MSHNPESANYVRFFRQRQKVFLVNMSEERDSEIYESLSGIVTSCGSDTIELMIPQAGSGAHTYEAGKTTFKLISEAMGSGIQVKADLAAVVGTVFKLKLHGQLEMFQRRIVPRIDVSIPIFQLCGNFSLGHLKKEWKRVIDHLKNNGQLSGLALQKTTINLSAGGIGLVADAQKRPSPISLLIVSLDEASPVCALAETAWEKRLDDGQHFGFRFIHIRKADQERINKFVAENLKASGGTHLDYKRSMVFLDRMG